MGISLPYHRVCRPIKNPNHETYSGGDYILDRQYCKSGHSYVRAYMLILKDLKDLFEYIEPSSESMETFSFRIHELFMRTCIEIEANLKAILMENNYTPDNDRFENPIYNISIYRKVNISHHLSSFKIGLPQWRTNGLLIFTPFESWATNGSLSWYQDYNKSKHDRHDNFKYANLNNLINAVAGLLIVISAQFGDKEFSDNDNLFSMYGVDYYGMESSTGGLFRIEYPKDWNDEDKYDFDWSKLKEEENRFQKFNYDAI